MHKRCSALAQGWHGPPSCTPDLPRAPAFHHHSGKVLALELVKVLLENSGPVFRRADKFLAAIRQYLCLSLLKNSASALPAAQALCVSIFMSLLTRFRTALKAEVGGMGGMGFAGSSKGLLLRYDEHCCCMVASLRLIQKSLLETMHRTNAVGPQVGVFFPMILLKPLEGPAGPPQGAPGAPQQPQPLNAAAVQHKVGSGALGGVGAGG